MEKLRDNSHAPLSLLSPPGDEERCRKIYEDSLLDDKIDMQPRREGDDILYAFAVDLYVAEKP